MKELRSRIELAEHFAELGFKVGAEVGVAEGRYAEILFQKIPDLFLWAIDPWTPYDGNWRGQGYQDRAYKQCEDRLKNYNAGLIRKTGMEASREIADDTLDFVFIDGDHHFDYIMEDIITWSRKVRKGGIISGHDYYPFASGGVVQAVDAYVKAHNIDLQIITTNRSQHRDDKVPCWWFVKE